MRQVFIMFLCIGLYTNVNAQQNKEPQIVHDAPTLFDISYDPYYDYADQGNRSYINNSQFQNKDNMLISSFPAGNGQYDPPGNSHSINQQLYKEPNFPVPPVYNGHVPVLNPGDYNR